MYHNPIGRIPSPMDQVEAITISLWTHLNGSLPFICYHSWMVHWAALVSIIAVTKDFGTFRISGASIDNPLSKIPRNHKSWPWQNQVTVWQHPPLYKSSQKTASSYLLCMSQHTEVFQSNLQGHSTQNRSIMLVEHYVIAPKGRSCYASVYTSPYQMSIAAKWLAFLETAMVRLQ